MFQFLFQCLPIMTFPFDSIFLSCLPSLFLFLSKFDVYSIFFLISLLILFLNIHLSHSSFILFFPLSSYIPQFTSISSPFISPFHFSSCLYLLFLCFLLHSILILSFPSFPLYSLPVFIFSSFLSSSIQFLSSFPFSSFLYSQLLFSSFLIFLSLFFLYKVVEIIQHLETANIKVSLQLRQAFILLHSYVRVKHMVKSGDHTAAAR